VAADHHLGDHNRYPHDGDAEEKKYNESPSTVHAGYVGEFPDIAEAYRRTGRSHDETEATVPNAAFWFTMMFSHEIALIPHS
jgi:hypothetical protein